MSYRKPASSSSASSSKKYAVVNTTVFKPPPSSQHSSQQGKLLVLHRPVSKNSAPAPINTASLRKETSGKDASGMVPVGQSTVWGSGNKSSENDTSQQDTTPDTSQTPTISTKPAPWAKSSSDNNDTSSIPKMQSWAASDSEDSDEETSPPAPLPGYLSSPITAAPATSVAPTTSGNGASHISARQTSPAPTATSSSAVSNPVIRRSLADMTKDFSRRDRDGRDFQSRPSERSELRQSYQGGGWNRFDQEPPNSRRFMNTSGYSRDRSDSWGRSDVRPGIATTTASVRDRERSSVGAPSHLGGMMHEKESVGGPMIDSSMTEEQKALERARYERQQLEIRKRQQIEAEERRKREAEAERIAAEEAKAREAEERIRRERQQEQDMMHRQKNEQYGGGRWERAVMPAAAPSVHYAPSLHGPPPEHPRGLYQPESSSRGAPNMVPSEYRPRLYSGENDKMRAGQRHRTNSMDSTGSNSRGSDRGRRDDRENVSNVRNPHIQSFEAPTRILQHQQPQQKKLFDSKSGNFIVQETPSTLPPKGERKEKDGAKREKKKSSEGTNAWAKVESAENKDSKKQHKESRDGKRESRGQEASEEEQRKQDKRNAELAEAKEARAKERAERQPRTDGVLYRFLTAEEAEEMNAKYKETNSSAYFVEKLNGKFLCRVLSLAEEKDLAERDEHRARKADSYSRFNKRADRDGKRKEAKRQQKYDRRSSSDSDKGNDAAPTGLSGDQSPLCLEEMTIDDYDVHQILQESVEFQQVKSKRTVAQEKKLNDSVVVSSSSRRPDRKDNKKPSKESVSLDSAVSVSSPLTTPSPPPSSLTPPNVSTPPTPPLAPPTQPAWVGTGNTFKAIGVSVEETEDTNHKAHIDKSVDDSDVSNDKDKPSPGPTKTGKSKREANAKKLKKPDRISGRTPKNKFVSGVDADDKSNSKSSVDSLSMTAATLHLQNNSKQQANIAEGGVKDTADILEMSAELDQQDMNQNMAKFSQFVPGIGLTENRNDMNDMNSSGKSGNGGTNDKSSSDLESLMGLGTFESSSASWQFTTTTSARPHTNSNVSDDENAYTHHTEALTQLTEGDDDNDLPYSRSNIREKESGGHFSSEDDIGKFSHARGGGRMQSRRGGRGMGRGSGRFNRDKGRGGGGGKSRGPPAVPLGNDARASGATVQKSAGDSLEKDHSEVNEYNKQDTEGATDSKPSRENDTDESPTESHDLEAGKGSRSFSRGRGGKGFSGRGRSGKGRGERGGRIHGKGFGGRGRGLEHGKPRGPPSEAPAAAAAPVSS